MTERDEFSPSTKRHLALRAMPNWITSESPTIHPKPLPVACGNGAIDYFLRLGSSFGLT
jgi:hypothetical protein